MFTILVVEDDQNLRKLMTAYLHMNGYRVLQAANGQEALEEMERTLPDLVIADITTLCHGRLYPHRSRSGRATPCFRCLW